jgi:murein DD-endopeptidase MepM/ murein hydrolase activator NlpD
MPIDPAGFATTLAQSAGANQPADFGADEVEAAQAFEGYLVEMMVQQMRKTIPEGIFQSTGVEMFSSMFDQAVAKEIAASGGFGLAASMATQMSGADPASVHLATEPGLGSARDTPIAPFADGPTPVDGVITSHFGYRKDPFSGENRFHKGLDIAAPVGTPIHSLAAGTVSLVGERRGYGRVVMVEHDDGWRSLYAHCDAMTVQPGQRIEAGEEIATVGSSGRSTGPHLHLELQHNGASVDPGKAMGW